VTVTPLLPLGVASVLLATGSAAAPPAPRQPPTSPPPLAVLDVPYVPQSEALCGGAAAAMVERYWGRPGARAEDFADQSGPSGIRVEALVARLGVDGFEARPFAGSAAETRHHLGRGRPVVALIEVAPGRNHYVVILAWAGGRVLLHDPADAPFRVVPEAGFLSSWSATGYLSLLILPGPTRPAPPEVPTAPPAPSSLCDGLIGRAATLARQGDLDGAEVRVLAAREMCPGSARPLRELAGIQFHRRSWSEASRLAAAATRIDPDDGLSWRLLATSRFMEGDRDGALRAWNRMGEPRLDLVHVDGLQRIPFRVVEDRLSLQPEAMITPDGLRRAERRLSELPGLTRSVVTMHPQAGGRAQVDVAVLERPLVPTPGWLLAGWAADALTERRLRLRIANPTRRGELLEVGGRFWENRPALWLSAAWPAPRWGTVELAGRWERQAYATTTDAPGATVTRETRWRGSVRVSDWWRPGLWAQAGAAVDGWEGRGTHLGVFTALEARTAADRAVIRGSVAAWAPSTHEEGFASIGLEAVLRSRPEPGAGRVELRAGAFAVSSNAPLALWPGAGTGHARPWLLRAHPLLDHGILTGETFGRRLVHASLEGTLASWSLGPLHVDAAAFADTATAWHSLTSDGRVPWRLDLGGGLRLRLPGQGSALRIDAAVGTDGRFAWGSGLDF